MKKIALLILFISFSVQSQIAFKYVAIFTDREYQFQNVERNLRTCIIDDQRVNGNPDLLLFITPDWGTRGPYISEVIVPRYDSNTQKWKIDAGGNGLGSTGIPENTKFNILVANPGSNAYVHTARRSSDYISILDHPLLNNNPNAKLLVSNAYNPENLSYNNNTIGVYYNGSHWAIFNQNRSGFTNDSNFNILIQSNIFIAEATTRIGNNFTLNNPAINDNPNALVFTTQYFTSIYNPNTTGVWYSRNRWKIFNQNRAAMPRNAKFMVLTLDGIPYRNTDNEIHIQPNFINEVLCPKILTQGDREFDGHGPLIHVNIMLEPRNETEVWAIIDFSATETTSDWSRTTARWERPIFNSPRIIETVLSEPSSIDFTSTKADFQIIGHISRPGDDINGKSGGNNYDINHSGFVSYIRIVGDTGGLDISDDDDCKDDTRIEAIYFHPIKVRFAN